MQEYCHIKCAESLDKEYKITSRYEECHCPIYDYDYDAYLFSKGIWDKNDYDRKSYAHHRAESDLIHVKCEVCKEEESTCCLAGYCKIY